MAQAPSIETSAAAAPDTVAFLRAIVDSLGTDWKGPLPEVLPKSFIKLQCVEWFEMLAPLYKKVRRKARNMQLYAGWTSLGIIVLNVLIVGKGDLGLDDVVVAVFVIIMTLLKAVQVLFQFSFFGAQLSSSLAAIRDTIVAVENTRSLASYGPADKPKDSFVTKFEYQMVKAKVVAAVQGVTPWMCRSLIKDYEAKVVAAKAAHGAAPPLDDFDVEAQDPMRQIQVDGDHTMSPPLQAVALPSVDLDSGAAVCLETMAEAKARILADKEATVAEQRQVLIGMSNILKPGVKSAGFFFSLFNLIGTTQTVVELASNAMIMALSSIPNDSFLYLSNRKDAVLAILAAINGVVKGIDMKVQFEVLKENAAETLKALKQVECKIDVQLMELTANSKNPLNSTVFNAYKNEFQALVSKYATWLKVEV